MAEGATAAERMTGGKEAPGVPGVRQAAVARMATSISGQNKAFGPGPDEKLPQFNPRYKNPVTEANRRANLRHANRSGVYYGGSRPRPIPNAGRNRQAYGGKREGESRA